MHCGADLDFFVHALVSCSSTVGWKPIVEFQSFTFLVSLSFCCFLSLSLSFSPVLSTLNFPSLSGGVRVYGRGEVFGNGYIKASAVCFFLPYNNSCSTLYVTGALQVRVAVETV